MTRHYPDTIFFFPFCCYFPASSLTYTALSVFFFFNVLGGREMSPSSLSCSGSSLLFVLYRLFIVFLAIFGLAGACKAQDKVEVYGGYSYLRASIEVGQFPPAGPPPFNTTQHANLNGWEFSGQYKVLPFLGAVADFNGNYGTLNGSGVREHTFMFGPQVSLPARVSPFAHALFGVARESQDFAVASGPLGAGLFADTSFATALGAGIDVNLFPLVKLRLIQFDYLRTQLYGATQNQPRVSAGVVFHF